MLKKYFYTHNIEITNKIDFIPHWQNQGFFVDKEEKWVNDFKGNEI